MSNSEPVTHGENGLGAFLSRKKRPNRERPSIALIGSYPPPYGGITVHLKRLAGQLENKNYDYCLYNTASDSDNIPRVKSVYRYRYLWYVWFCLTHNYDIVHSHTVNWPGRLMLGIAATIGSSKYILSIHGRSLGESYEKGSRIKKRLTRWFTRKMDRIIAVNPYIKEECTELIGVDPEKVIVVPAFLPPLPNSNPNLPASLRRFIGERQLVIYAVGAIGVMHRGREVYGFDTLLSLVERLKGDFPALGLVLGVTGGSSEDIDRMKNSTQGHAQGSVFFHDVLPDVSDIMRASTVFLRPTNTDGDSVAIREALYVGTPVVASDIIPRPDGCLLYHCGDLDDLEQVVRSVLVDPAAHRDAIEAVDLPDNAIPITNLYTELLAE